MGTLSKSLFTCQMELGMLKLPVTKELDTRKAPCGQKCWWEELEPGWSNRSLCVRSEGSTSLGTWMAKQPCKDRLDQNPLQSLESEFALCW